MPTNLFSNVMHQTKTKRNENIACFTPLVFSANGGMSRECKKFYSRLAETISAKRKEKYAITMSWLRRKISFSLMRLILLCIRGNRGKNVNQEEANITNDIQMSESLSTIHEQ